MNVILFDTSAIRQQFLPLTFTRPVCELRVGIQTITEKWADYFHSKPSFLTENYLTVKYPQKPAGYNWYINGAICPNDALVSQIKALEPEECLRSGDVLVAVRTIAVLNLDFQATNFKLKETEVSFTILQQITDIFSKNAAQIEADFARITEGRTSQPITDRFTAFYNESQIFIEEGADIKAASLNAEKGAIYIGRNAVIQEGSHIQGPFALCEGSTINLGGKMRPNTTIGPHCKVGGEVSNVVFIGNSNKGHDGFLGNAVLGEWCNLGAATNNSNLKNDYGKVDLYNYVTEKFESTGLQFCGLIMGDHSKTAIGTLFNTGTVVGVNCNIFVSGLTPRHIPSFTWGGGDDSHKYVIGKALQVASITMDRRGKVLDEMEEGILKAVYEITEANPSPPQSSANL